MMKLVVSGIPRLQTIIYLWILAMLPSIYFVTIALEAFCLYHAYTRRTDQKWYYIIIFIPVFGCLFYLYDTFYSRRSVTQVTEVLKQVVNSNYKIEQLEKQAKFSNSATNSMRLADAYVEVGRYAEAAELYDGCRVGFMAEDEGLKKKLLNAWYLAGDFEKCVQLGLELTSSKSFKNADERVSYAWALHNLGKNEEAKKHFDEMNRTYTNYPHRRSYCDFLIATNNLPAAKELAGELASEFETMKGPERKVHREIMRQVADLQQQLGKS
jgi:hypothetical protein